MTSALAAIGSASTAGALGLVALLVVWLHSALADRNAQADLRRDADTRADAAIAARDAAVAELTTVRAELAAETDRITLDETTRNAAQAKEAIDVHAEVLAGDAAAALAAVRRVLAHRDVSADSGPAAGGAAPGATTVQAPAVPAAPPAGRPGRG